MFRCRYPLQQAGIGGFTSPDLAIAVSCAGGFGMLSGTIGSEALVAQLDAVPTVQLLNNALAEPEPVWFGSRAAMRSSRTPKSS